jgi:hypothetical protein
MKISVGFYKINWWVMRVIAFFSRAQYDHCSLLCLEPGESPKALHRPKRKNAKFVRLSTLNRLYKPETTVYMGETDAEFADIEKYLYPQTRFRVWKIVLWFFITRWFIRWQPAGGCGVLTCKMLNECGFKVGSHVIPTALYKEISDATNFPVRASRRGEVISSRSNSC